jgi:hypothetical protein
MATDPLQKSHGFQTITPLQGMPTADTGVIVRVPGLFPRTLSRVSDIQFTRELFLRLEVLHIFLQYLNGIKIIIFNFERSICAKVVTYHLDVVYGFLHTQQLRGFDEMRNDQVIIQKYSVMINTIVASLYLPASTFSFRILRLAKKNGQIENGENRVFFKRLPQERTQFIG